MQEISEVLQHYILSKYNTKFQPFFDSRDSHIQRSPDRMVHQNGFSRCGYHIYHIIERYGHRECISNLALVCKRWFRILRMLTAQNVKGVSMDDLPFKIHDLDNFKEQPFLQYLPLSLAHVHTFIIDCGSNERNNVNYSRPGSILSIISAMTSLERVILQIVFITLDDQPEKKDNRYEKRMLDLVESINRLERDGSHVKIQANLLLMIYDGKNKPSKGIWSDFDKFLSNDSGVEVTEMTFDHWSGCQDPYDYVFETIFNTAVSLKQKNITIDLSCHSEGSFPIGFKLFENIDANGVNLERVNIKGGLVKIRDINVLLQSKTIKSLTIGFQWHNEYDQHTKQGFDSYTGYPEDKEWKRLKQESAQAIDINNQYSVSPLLEEMSQRLQHNKTLTSLTIKHSYVPSLGGNWQLAKRSIHLVKDCFANILSNNQTSLKHLEFERADDYLDDRFYQSIANNTTLESLKLCFLKYSKSKIDTTYQEYLKQIVVSISKSLSINRSLQSLEIGVPFRDDDLFYKVDLMNHFRLIPNRNCLIMMYKLKDSSFEYLPNSLKSQDYYSI
ncbi:hypothetical protein DFA_11117 [Cavenderia fasciculata]|uniref:F-box domain-containing protein n=1 Tax=Cavenderia fasciculata TaxID=261658 RepID=F4QEZ7_CACFS|nr:uncharacterized protein DFA_11117 [Cavenderia fasciculata]EGG13356.1 hypothetical protein DFA_11117 [Cavenderia fasciculata]|eukprot:XP_004350060.1 hypothetical protein DFA_11117 [Cavenderia fasciculata]